MEELSEVGSARPSNFDGELSTITNIPGLMENHERPSPDADAAEIAEWLERDFWQGFADDLDIDDSGGMMNIANRMSRKNLISTTVDLFNMQNDHV